MSAVPVAVKVLVSVTVFAFAASGLAVVVVVVVTDTVFAERVAASVMVTVEYVGLVPSFCSCSW